MTPQGSARGGLSNAAAGESHGLVEPMTGIEPAYSAWEADVLPLNYIGGVARETSIPGPGDGAGRVKAV